MGRPRTLELPKLGDTFGDWKFLSEFKDNGIRWNCICVKCDKTYSVNPHHLVSGASKRCVKCSDDNMGAIGKAFSILGPRSIRNKWRRAYFNMMARCYDKRAIGFKHYGGRGILVHTELQKQKSFANFIKTLDGYDNASLTLERINVDCHYWPGNIRLATRHEQALNKRVKVECEYGHPYVAGSYYTRVRVKNGVESVSRQCKECTLMYQRKDWRDNP